MTVQATYKVSGMTCGHCVQAVSGELQQLPGVSAVTVDLPSGAVIVASDTPLTEQDVRAAVDEAGYELVGDGGD
ncbi:MAG: heavy-metal-associated domain-containing protein [Micromonosporaceae bacterium]